MFCELNNFICKINIKDNKALIFECSEKNAILNPLPGSSNSLQGISIHVLHE